jgi:hypothetical protein
LSASSGNFLDNIYSKYDDPRLTVDEQFSTLYKLEDFKSRNVILRFDYSRKLNSFQVRLYEGLDPQQEGSKFFDFFLNLKQNFWVLQIRGQKCIKKDIDERLKISMYDLDTFWFYSFLKVSQPRDEEPGYLKYKLNITGIEEMLPLSKKVDTQFVMPA